MKKLIFALALFAPLAAWGQDFNFGARASAEVDYKIVKGLHISAGEELRMADNFAGLGSLRTSVGLSYKPLKFLKVGVGYILINPYKINKELDPDVYYTGFWAPRHRVYGDVAGSVKFGAFQFTLKERLQLTHNSYAGLNTYQSTRNVLGLKSKLTVKYKGLRTFQPYLAFEIRAALNDPWGTASGEAQLTGQTKRTYYYYTPAGHTHAYINRYRVELGGDIIFSRQHSLQPYLLLDYLNDYVIDTNADGNRIFTDNTGWENSFCGIFGIQYSFSF